MFDEFNFVCLSLGKHTIRRFINPKTNDCPPNNEWIYEKNYDPKKPTLVKLKFPIPFNTYL